MPNSTQSNAYNGALVTGIGVIQDQLGNVRVVGAQMPTGAGAGNVLASDAAGNLTLQPVSAASLPSATTTTQGAVILDGTAADIAPLGVQAAGSTGKAADAGHVHPNQGLPSLLVAPAGATAETMPRILAASSSLNAGSTGILYLTAIGIPAGVTVSNITFVVTGTAKTGGTHGWYVLADSGLVVRAVTADQTDPATVWGTINTAYTLPVTAPYVTPAAALHYVGVMVAESGGGVPSFAGSGSAMSAGISSIAPSLAGFSGSGLTTPPAVSSTLATMTAQPNRPMYAFTS